MLGFDDLLPILVALVGGFVAGIVAVATQRAIGKREDRKHFVERMEDAYRLSQELYEGHEGEVIKARGVGGKSMDEWFQDRQHPGKHMSEIKLIVSAYTPHLSSALDRLNEGHSALKQGFQTIDRAILNGDKPQDACRRHDADFDYSLKLLAEGVNAIKSGTSSEISKRFKRFQRF